MKAVLIDIKKGLSPRLLGCYGNTAAETHHLDRLAQQSVVFDHCYSTRVQTSTSETATEQQWQADLKQRLNQHQVQLHSQQFTIDSDQLPDNFVRRDQTGFAMAEDSSLLIVELVCSNPKVQLAQIDSFIGKINSWIAENQSQPLVLFRGGHQNNQFAGESEFRESSETLLHEEQIHLPLIVQMPNAETGQRCHQIVAAGDVFATLYDWFGITQPESFQGDNLASLLPLMDHNPTTHMREHLIIQCTDQPCLGIRNEEFYLINRANELEPGEPILELYLKPEDRWEINNVAAQYTEVVTELLSLPQTKLR